MSSHEGRTGEEEKIILNGGVAGEFLTFGASLLKEICKTIYSHTEHGHFSPEEAQELVKAANKLEDEAQEYVEKIHKFRRKVLESVGFAGPWPKSLS